MFAGAGFVYGADVLMSTIGVGDPAELWRQEAHRDSADSSSAALHQVTGSSSSKFNILFYFTFLYKRHAIMMASDND
jgi:hypothetical protein